MRTRALLDTNILILHLGREKFFYPLTSHPFISVLTCFEILRFPGLSSEEEKRARFFLSFIETVPVTSSIADRAASLARTKTRRKAIDLLLAATALEHGVPIITFNQRDFKGIPELKVLVP